MALEAVETIVAHAIVGADGRIDIQAPPSIEVPVGALLVLKATYRIRDERDAEEDTEIRFQSQTGGTGPAPATIRRHDHPILNDEAWGYLSQSHRFQAKGDHVVQFELIVRQARHGWGHAEDEESKVLRAEGTLAVRAV